MYIYVVPGRRRVRENSPGVELCFKGKSDESCSERGRKKERRQREEEGRQEEDEEGEARGRVVSRKATMSMTYGGEGHAMRCRRCDELTGGKMH